MKRFVLTTFGSLGDLHPYMAIALELQARGHEAILATSEGYRQKIEAEGIGFRPVRPDGEQLVADPQFIRRVVDPRNGSRFVIRDVMMKHLRASYADLLEAVRGADLLVTHPITYAGPLVAQKTGMRWVSTVLSPVSFFSAYDPLALPIPRWFVQLHKLGPRRYGAILRAARRLSYPWGEEARRLCAEIGLPPVEDPLFAGQHSPERVLALFSRALGAPQPDWPPLARLTGFAFYDRNGTAGLAPELERFLEGGPPPLVFTLGSAAVMVAGQFYRESAEAARRLGMRAVLLTGRDEYNHPEKLPAGVAAFDYAPYSQILPRAAAIIHQGGVGATGQALRAGRPMLVVPYAQDQPDNAARVTRLGVARTLPRPAYTAARAARELERLLHDSGYAARAREVGCRVRAEDGVRAAADAIEEMLS